MKTSTKTLLLAAALVVAAVCAAPTEARRARVADHREGTRFFRLGELVTLQGVNVDWRDGQVVGLNVLQGDGSWLPLTRSLRPPYAANCPGGQKLSCWGDDRETLGICVCAGGVGAIATDKAALLPGGTATAY